MFEIKALKFAMVCWLIVLLGFIFLVISCGPVYKAIGLTDQEAVEQWEKDKVHIIDTIESGREGLWQIISGTIAAVGAIASGLLAKWLSTEKKVSATLIRSIETATEEPIKEVVHKMAVANGVEKVLAKKVQALT